MQRERPDVDFPVAEKNDVLKMSTSFSVTPMKGVGSIQHNQLLLSGELDGYLAKLDKQAEEQLALTVRQMQEVEGVTEALKAADQLEWVRRMNSIRNRAEEIILREIVFNTYKNQAFA